MANLLARVVLGAVVLASLGVMQPASASSCASSTSGAAGGGEIFVHAQSECDADESATGQSTSGASNAAYFTAYEWRSACGNVITATQGGSQPCSSSFACGPGELPYRLYGLHDGIWIPRGLRCFAQPPPSIATPQVTAAMVAQAFQRIPLPSYRSVAQPGETTLVNFDTIFHADATTLSRTVTLLGQRVELAITPSEFRWEFGDGEVLTTESPGAAYPSKAIVHRYQDAQVTEQHRVVVTWTATYRLNGGAAQPVPGSVTTTGPPSPIRVAEAVPALSGEGH